MGVAAALLVLGVAALAVGAVAGAKDPARADSAAAASSTPATPSPSVPATSGTTGADTTSRSARVQAPAGSAPVAPTALRPARISIPAIGVDASVTKLGVARDGTIEVPQHPLQAGWLTTSPAPGQQGPAVIAGHVDSTTGPAVFYKLSDLKTGDAIVVTRHDGSRQRFTVDGVSVYPKAHFPTAETYGPVPGPALRLITCGGDYVRDRGGYQDNVVVFAS